MSRRSRPLGSGGRDLDPLSFNANFYFKGLEAWQEFKWGTNIKLGLVQFEAVKYTQLCAAISINRHRPRVIIIFFNPIESSGA